MPAGEVRRAVRLFARRSRPATTAGWDSNSTPTPCRPTGRSRLFYALTGQFDRRGSNVLFASTPTNLITGLELLPAGAGRPPARPSPSAPWARRAIRASCSRATSIAPS